MNKQKASPVGEATFLHLHRRLLSAQLLNERLAFQRGETGRLVREPGNAAIAAAVTENLLEGDTLGLAAGDLTARYLCGMPLAALRQAAQPRRGRLKSEGWSLPVDAEHGVLPGTGEEQARFATGTALASRLNHSGGITVLLDRSLAAARKPGQASPAGWDEAARTAVALRLPLLLISASPAATPPASRPGPKRQPAALPSIPVDREDTLAIYRVIYESAARARTGGGPTWIECGQWTVDGAAGAITPATPLERMEEALRARHLFDRQQRRHLQHALEKEFAQAGWPPAV